MTALAVIADFYGKDAILCRASELAVPFDGLDFVLAHQELETFGVLGDDVGLAVLDRGPIQLARINPLDAEFFRLFEVIPKLGIKEESLGGNTAHVQAGAS